MVTVPPGWMTVRQHSATNMAGAPVDPAYRADEELPPPRSVQLSLSGWRDASTVRVSYDGIIPRRWLQKQLELWYGNERLWYVGADDCRYRLREGLPTTDVTFRVGPYRASRRTRYNASYYLYEELAQEFPGLLDGMTHWNGLARPVVTPPFTTPMPPANPNFVRDESSEVAFWRYIVGHQEDPTVTPRQSLGFGAAYTDTVRDEILTQINRDCFMGYLQYDDVVRQLYERWHILVRPDPDYLAGISPADLFLNPDNIPSPPLFARNVLDLVEIYYAPVDPTGPPLTNIPALDDISLEAPLQLHLREDEETALQFYSTGVPLHPDLLAPIGGTGTTKRLLDPGANYWRFGTEWHTYLAGTENDIPEVNAANPWTLWSGALMPDIYLAGLQHHLAQQMNFFPNRQRRITAPAPLEAATVRQLLPGMPVSLSRTGAYYWVAELNISTPPLVMTLDVVYPGQMPAVGQRTPYSTRRIVGAGGAVTTVAGDWRMPTTRGWDGDLPQIGGTGALSP